VPTKIEKDAVTGHMTTGHEWDGLRELNQPLPKWWIYILYATIAWSLGYFVLYPAIPWFGGATPGILGYTTRDAVEAEVAAISAQRAVYMDRIKALPYEEIRKDPQLMAAAMTAGRIAFAENCQPCHGAGGGGVPGYPALAAGNWLWGGTLEDIQHTVTHGIRAAGDDTRQSLMPRFGADGILKPAEIASVTDYVMAMYGTPVTGADMAAGEKIYAENCAVCHGDKGQGDRTQGAPRLSARTHLFGDDRAAVMAQISNPRHGMMPAWNTRLDAATIKAVTLYVHGLGGGE
jgi:cytochrome c oxidase cbb3-type subunit 3